MIRALASHHTWSIFTGDVVEGKMCLFQILLLPFELVRSRCMAREQNVSVLFCVLL